MAFSQIKLQITPQNASYGNDVEVQLQGGSLDGTDLLSPTYFVSSSNLNTPTNYTTYYALNISGGSTTEVVIDASNPAVLDGTGICFRGNSFGYGGLDVVILGVDSEGGETNIGSGSTAGDGNLNCIAMDIPVCFIYSDIQVGQEYNIESADGLKTGVVKITSIDSDTCNLCFQMVSGDWFPNLWDPAVDKDVKIFYNSGGIDHCILNKEDPIWHDVTSNTYFTSGPSGFTLSWNGSGWNFGNDSNGTWSDSLVENSPAGDPLIGEGVFGVRGTINHTGSLNALTVNLVSDSGTESVTLDFSASTSESFEFTFSNPPPLGTAFVLEFSYTGGSAYAGTFTLDVLEFLLLPSVISQL